MDPMILAINPGSTSTKAAVYRGERCLLSRELTHSPRELAAFGTAAEQAPLREGHLLALLREAEIPPDSLKAAVGIGGLLPPAPGGIYLVDAPMTDYLTHRAPVDHASNLGAILARRIALPLGIPAYICDPVTTDELSDLARISGLPELPRVSTFHALNIKAMGRRAAAALGRPLEQTNLVVAHLGGGVSCAALEGGRAVDLVLDDEGAFSPVRSGGLPASDLVRACYGGTWPDGETAYRRIRGAGGFSAYLGTHDLQAVEERVRAGDRDAARLTDACAYQMAKSIAALGAVFSGRVDAVVLTGGAMRWERLAEAITARVAFLAPVLLYPGQGEMEALAGAALGALTGREAVRAFVPPQTA